MESSYKEIENNEDENYSGIDLDEIVIPELEEAPLPRYIPWSAKEEAILRKYYGRVPISRLAQYFDQHMPIKRSRSAIASKAKRMGIANRPL